VLLPLMMYFFSAGRLIFGAAKPTPVDLRNTRNPRLANLAVSAAGPLSNFLLAAIGVGLLLTVRGTWPGAIRDLALAIQGHNFAAGALAPIVYLLFQFALVNVGLAVFNLIPIPPLDGSGVLASLAGEPVARLFRTIAPFGFFILILLLSTRLLGAIIRPFYLFVYTTVFGISV
ncbi:MAG: site-2 protease family protein, partial [Thermoanaerobaculia bacterium]